MTLLARSFAAIACAFALAFNGSVRADEAPPSLGVTLAPQWDGEEVIALGVSMLITAPELDEGEALLRIPLMLVGTPTAALAADEFEAHDDFGALVLTAQDEDPDASGIYRRYLVGRPTAGDVRVSYAAPPREVDAQTRGGPLFDMRRQENGLIGAGVYFFAVPPGNAPWTITLDWDLSAMPEGARGVWSLGEGRQQTIAPANLLNFSFYAAGLLSSESEDGEGNFSIYWFEDPPFNVNALARQTRALYDYMARFFDDEGAPYRIFIRYNVHPGGGGTALARSFMVGYDPQGETTAGGMQQLLAHEMAHNWPRLSGGAHAETAWYTEGTAEFYSLVLLLRSGQMDLDGFISAINRRAANYYTNPHLALSNIEAGALFWSDPRAQRLPYGRGLLYLISVDAQLREATGGAVSLDDIVVGIFQAQRDGEAVGLEGWVERIGEHLGEQAQAGFDAMAAGETITPPGNAFAPCLRVVPAEFATFELGFDDFRLGQVTSLDEASAAYEAGAREGDIIHAMTPPLRVARDDPEAAITLDLERDGERFEISFDPRGESLPGWKWERVEGVDESACGI
ncbi:MAG: hypothetical protein JJU26_00385 [Oceanicaulis sp.]|uniref:hypothetical protein n=1 Tax=Glycocaulis sp. TaxID=1969725 RepID=UPI0025B856D2|nr:hypothetical protein [Glycocaulis sp.]MCC5980155.1 hypothetical protein [Oceanicaulis sp.]MCH8522481.1 hypothetical protein [Glycocaulis sp.]